MGPISFFFPSGFEVRLRSFGNIMSPWNVKGNEEKKSGGSREAVEKVPQSTA